MKQKQLVNLLILKGYKISAAESCTGGMFLSKIVSVPDASKVLDSGLVTYSNAEKVRLCKVQEKTIKEQGVVSEEVARQMAEGVAKMVSANVGVGISGIAGPTGGTPDKPVGTVCFGFFVNGNIYSFTCHFKGKRNHIRREAVRFAINKIIEIL